MLDVAIVGAGAAGLICAQQLRRSGYGVALIEKSRGLGGRIATRRLHATCADHGLRYLNEQGDRTRALIAMLRDRGLVQPWIDIEYQFNGELRPTDPQPRYVATDGMTAIAKTLATHLDIHRSLRVVRLSATQSWQLTCDSGETFKARSIVLAIPAPQAVALLESIESPPANLLSSVQAAEFDPCLTVIATYAAEHQAEVESLPWRSIEPNHADLGWIGIDSSKRTGSIAPVVVVHSSPDVARHFLDAEDLQAIGQQILDRAAKLLPWINQPESMQVHRWRYAFAQQGLGNVPAVAHPLPIVCCGDWCMGTNLEAALHSGEVAADRINDLLDGRSLPSLNFAEIINA